MRASCQSMQRSDPESRMCMTMCALFLFLFCMAVLVDVKVDVPLAVVFMFVRVDVVFQSAAQSPQAYAKQHHSNEPFAPGGNKFHGNQVAQPQ